MSTHVINHVTKHEKSKHKKVVKKRARNNLCNLAKGDGSFFGLEGAPEIGGYSRQGLYHNQGLEKQIKSEMILEYQSKYKKILFAIAAIFLIGGISYIAWSKFSYKPGPVFCTQEAKQCADGSYVGRTGPKCEFAACPNGISPKISNSGIRGTVLLGPICPVVKDPPDPDCSDKPYATNLVLTTADQSRVIAEFSSNTYGKFEIKIQPGEYAIRSAVAANILPYCSTNDTIGVDTNSYAETIVYCDTGIR